MNEENVSTTPAPRITGAGVDGVRSDLAARLPGLIDDAINRYLVFTSQDPPEKARDFAAFSTACRAAIAHLEQLLKLARTLSPEAPESPTPQDDIGALIARAEAALEKAGDDA